MHVTIFFDTEFTRLSEDARLISIGMVNQSGEHEFYAELADTYALQQCSEFCLREVIPHLEAGRCLVTMTELRSKLSAWLLERGSPVELVCDSRRDVLQLSAIFPGGMPPDIRCRVLGWWSKLILRLRRRRIQHSSQGLRRHHALDDAKANRAALESMI